MIFWGNEIAKARERELANRFKSTNIGTLNPIRDEKLKLKARTGGEKGRHL